MFYYIVFLPVAIAAGRPGVVPVRPTKERPDAPDHAGPIHRRFETAALVNILGLSFSITTPRRPLVDGRLVAASEEERFPGSNTIRPTPSGPSPLPGQGGLTAADLDCVVFTKNPFSKFHRLIQTLADYAPRTGLVFRDAMVSWLGKALDQAPGARKAGRSGRPDPFEHHLSHAASAFFFALRRSRHFDGGRRGMEHRHPGPRDRAVGRRRGKTKSTFFPKSGFRIRWDCCTRLSRRSSVSKSTGEYKVMGMAPYGNRVTSIAWKN
ncbi:MAG: hypothetical protein IPP70_09100 [Elusimicrobia bacterium]|nr:hypothetical protein [Elusimicrobiota bacterium]